MRVSYFLICSFFAFLSSYPSFALDEEDGADMLFGLSKNQAVPSNKKKELREEVNKAVVEILSKGEVEKPREIMKILEKKIPGVEEFLQKDNDHKEKLRRWVDHAKSQYLKVNPRYQNLTTLTKAPSTHQTVPQISTPSSFSAETQTRSYPGSGAPFPFELRKEVREVVGEIMSMGRARETRDIVKILRKEVVGVEEFLKEKGAIKKLRKLIYDKQGRYRPLSMRELISTTTQTVGHRALEDSLVPLPQSSSSFFPPIVLPPIRNNFFGLTNILPPISLLPPISSFGSGDSQDSIRITLPPISALEEEDLTNEGRLD